MSEVSLERFLQAQGIGSRRDCRLLIKAGRVSIAGLPAGPDTTPPAPGGQFEIDGAAFECYALPLYLMLHKPGGFETSHQPQHHRSVFTLLPERIQQLGVQAVGRLDADTTGLLLLTTDGAFNHALTSPRKQVVKRYRVTLKHPAGPELPAALLDGVQLNDEPAPLAAIGAWLEDAQTLLLEIGEGKYHQVKRMVAAAGNRVVGLHREGFGGVELDGLAEGAWRWLSAAERTQLGLVS